MDRLRQIVRNRVLYRIPVYGERLERKHKEQAKVEARIRKFEREIKIEEDKHSKLNLTFGQHFRAKDNIYCLYLHIILW